MSPDRNKQENNSLDEDESNLASSSEEADPLSSREQKVLEFLLKGLANKQIAKELRISEKTVEKHLTAIYRKIGVASRAEAILWGMEKVGKSLLESDKSGSILKTENRVITMKKHLLVLMMIVAGIGVGIGITSLLGGLIDKSNAQTAATQVVMLSTASPPKQIISPTTTTMLGTEANQLVEELNAKAVAGLQVGWVHIQEKVNSDTDRGNQGTLPNGMAIPNQHTNDIWYHFDHGLVTEGVTIMRTTGGRIVQVGINSNGTSWNSGTDETRPFESFNLTGFDLGFLKNDLQWLESFGNAATIMPTVLPGGGEGVQITIGDEFDQPITTDDFIRPSIRAETRAVFDSTTGYLVSREVILWFLDGSQRVFSSLTQTVTFEPPTDEVLKYLSEKGKL